MTEVTPPERSILLAPLLAPSPRWSSRTLADLLGSSQSDIARAWARTYASGSGLSSALPDGAFRLVAVTVSPSNSMLVLAPARTSGPALVSGPKLFMRSVRRPALQTVLAADLLHTNVIDDINLDAAVARAAAGPGEKRYVLTRRPLPGLGEEAEDDASTVGGRGVVQIVVSEASQWQRLLEPLVRRCAEPTLPELTVLQHQLMQWARAGTPRFQWVDSTGPVVAPRWFGPPPATARAVADEMFALLIRRLVAGRLHAGDRLTEADLARTLHASRTHVRDALRTLASDGLVDLTPNRGAVVPSPQPADVAETYAARRALGTLVVRRAVHLPAAELEPVEQALTRMLDLARSTEDSYLTGEADLDFQDALAQATGMRRIAPMFATTTAQLRLYVAVMGFTYSYPIADMCADDAALLQHIRVRDEAGAVRRWNAKIDAASGLMTTRLRQAPRPGRGRRPELS